MKLLLTIIDWEYPDDGKIPRPERLDVSEMDQVMPLYMSFANGLIVEMKAEGDSEEALKLIRGLASGAGSCTLIDTLANEDKARLWLYEEGYDCYRQGSGPHAVRGQHGGCHGAMLQPRRSDR